MTRYFTFTPLFVFLFLISSVQAVNSSFPGVTFSDDYRFHSGDSLVWANPVFDDSQWDIFPVNQFPEEQWQGIGWFRFDISVNPALTGIPLGIVIDQIGATELYLDGVLKMTQGQIGRSRTEELPYISDWYPVPSIFIFSEKEADSTGKIIYKASLRYSSFILENPITYGDEPRISIRFDDLDHMREESRLVRSKLVAHQMLLLGLFLAFGLIHFLFYLFYAKLKANLSFASIAFTAALVSYFRFESMLITDPFVYAWIARIFLSLVFLLIIAVLHFIYTLLLGRLPVQFRVFTGIAVLLMIGVWFYPFIFTSLLYFYILLVALEILRSIILARIRKQEPQLLGSRIVVLGFIPFALIAVYFSLVNFNLIPELWSVVDFPATYYAILILGFSMSLFLSRNFALTNFQLEQKLVEVQELSEKNLQQELHRVELEAENARKSAELEGARNLQLSMLSKTIPRKNFCQIAVFMQTATEVGGDYYDFYEEDERVTIAFGDATGHGMQSGTVVTASKSLFKCLAAGNSMPSTMEQMSDTLRQMGFGRMYMAMILARLEPDNIRLSCAGMPNPLIWRKQTATVEETGIPAPPLGTMRGTKYQEVKLSLKPGDTVLLVSDGLPELFNSSGEQMGENRINMYFTEIADRSPEEIITYLKNKAREWCGCETPDDDLTLMAIKYK